jgi:hypothetical protein
MSQVDRSSIRRIAFLASFACGLAAAGVARSEDPARDPTLIQRENAKPGATDWQLTRVRLDDIRGFRCPWIEGYCSKQSLKAGESLDIMVSTNPPGKFEIEIFRMGYYGGKGARRMTRLGPFEGRTQPTPKPGPKDIHECKWEDTAKRCFEFFTKTSEAAAAQHLGDKVFYSPICNRLNEMLTDVTILRARMEEQE